MSAPVMMLSRDVKRVPLDLDAPLNKVWAGYKGTNARPCPSDDCERGVTLAMRATEQMAQLILLLAEGSDRGQMHPYFNSFLNQIPGPQIKELTAGLAGRESSVFGHDACDRGEATRKLIKAAGLPEDWGICPVCEGRGIHPDDVAAADAWEPTEPPQGAGHQMWESVSEGSPISPVFPNPSELARWMDQHSGDNPEFGYTDWLEVITGLVTTTDLETGLPAF